MPLATLSHREGRRKLDEQVRLGADLLQQCVPGCGAIALRRFGSARLSVRQPEYARGYSFVQRRYRRQGVKLGQDFC